MHIHIAGPPRERFDLTLAKQKINSLKKGEWFEYV